MKRISILFSSILLLSLTLSSEVFGMPPKVRGSELIAHLIVNRGERKSDGTSIDTNDVLKVATVAISTRRNSCKDALNILRQLQDAQISPNFFHYNAAVKVCARGGTIENVKEVTSLIKEMKQKEIPTDIYTWNSVIELLAKVKTIKAAETAEEVLKRMWLLAQEGKVENTPNALTYHSVIQAYSQFGSQEIARKVSNLIHEMSHKRIVPAQETLGAAKILFNREKFSYDFRGLEEIATAVEVFPSSAEEQVGGSLRFPDEQAWDPLGSSDRFDGILN